MPALPGYVDDHSEKIFALSSRANTQTQMLRSAAILAAKRAGRMPALPGYVDDQLLILFGF
jgi:hypothetical protein